MELVVFLSMALIVAAGAWLWEKDRRSVDRQLEEERRKRLV